MNIEIANRLVQLRKKNNLSQEALAEKLGISRQAVSKWERAEASPDTDNLILLARIYGVSLDELLKTDEEVPIPVYRENDNVDNSKKGDSVYIDKNGIYINGEKREKHLFTNHAHFPIFSLILIIYLIIGCIWSAWHPGWLLFFLAPIWESLVVAIEKKNANCFAYPVLVVLIYLCLGFFWFLWHPGWVIFLTIPFYYPIVNYIFGFHGTKEDMESENAAEGAGEADES